jgi:hypothetical protein
VELSTRKGVPDRKFTLYFSRSLNRTSTFRFIIALSVPALAAAAITASSGVSGNASAQPVRPAQQIGALPAAAVRAGAVRAGAVRAGAVRASTGPSEATLLTTQATAALRSHRLGWKREIAWQMMYNRFDWRPKYQFRYVNWLWEHESGWRIHAYNPYSGAYGIPQAVPGSKMASAGPNWRNSARTQIRWGLRYIRSRYGKPRRAWAHECAYGWY